ncbi:MAG: phosphoribosylglycinamide synthetase, partial [Planctomycetota bacterium]|nr:phosphoribosylglycinamide synthetase [Planctomycetota bacterium]
VMAEEFLPGPQLSTESAILEGRAHTLGCSDRNYELLDELAPYVIENGGVQPTRHLDDVLEPVNELMTRAARSLGIENGTLKGGLVLHPERGLCIIEVAPRLSGGWFCTDQIPISTGVDLVQIAARIALGETIELDEVRPRAWNPVAVRYFFPPPGVLRAVEGFDDVAGLPWVHRAVLFAAPGDVLEPVTNHTRRAGLVITTGETRDEAVRRAEEAVRSVRFDVETRP